MVAEPGGPKVAFVDTSQYRGHVDAEAVKRSGKVGLFPRTSFKTSVDPLWAETIGRALDAGLVGMARHRIFGSPSVATQFETFRAAAEREVPGCEGILICLDSEDDASWSQVQDFEQRCHDRWGVWPVAYYPCWWLRGIGNPSLRAGQVFWHSRYDDAPGDLCGGRTSLAGQMWQYSQSGTCPGINPPVDLNWFYGTTDQLRALAVGGGGDELSADDVAEGLRMFWNAGGVIGGQDSAADGWRVLDDKAGKILAERRETNQLLEALVNAQTRET